MTNHTHRSRIPVSIAPLRIVSLAIVLLVHSLGASAQGLSVKPSPVVVIDGSGTTGSTLIQVHGPEPNTAATPISLTTGDVKSKATGRKLNAQVVFGKPADANGTNPYKDTVPAGEVLFIKATVSAMTEAGESEADLIHNGTRIGSLLITKRQVPLSVTIDGLKPESPDVFFERGKTATLTLKNLDPMTYPMKWKFTVGGKSVVVSDTPVVIGPTGSADIRFLPADDWFTSWFGGFLKDDVVTGRLRLQFVPLGGQTSLSDPSKDIPLNVHLAYWSANKREVGGALLTLVVLLLGGLSSMALNLSLPNQLRRLSVKDELKTVIPRIADIPVQVDSRARVMVGIEGKRLSDFINSRKWYSPDFGPLMDQASQSIGRLNTRVDLLQQLSLTLSAFYRVRNRMPPRHVGEIEEIRAKAIEILQKRAPQDSEIKVVEACISQIQQQLAALSQPDLKLAQILVNEAGAEKKEFDANGKTGKTGTCAAIRKELPGPFSSLDNFPTDPAAINPGDYADLDRTLLKLKLIREYVDLYEGRTDIDFRGTLDSYRAELLRSLALDNLDALFFARDLLAQMQAETFSKDLEVALTALPLQLVIETDRSEIHPFEPVKLSANFARKNLNSGETRRGWACIWDFGHDGLREKGWSVTHYFPEAKTYEITASFQHPEGHFITDSTGERVKKVESIAVKPAVAKGLGARAALEAVRLTVALLAAVVALMAGARDQITKLDVLPALLAVFALGFGADTIKNLLTSKPQ